MNPLVSVIKAPWIVPVVPHDTVLAGHAVVVENAQIVGVMPAEKAAQKYPDATTLSLDGQVLLPGFINAHTHGSVSLVRRLSKSGIPADERRWPLLFRHSGWGAGLVKDATMLAGVRMLMGGVTCCADTHFFPEAVTAAMLEVGMRACIGLLADEAESPADLNTTLHDGIALHDEYKYDQHITFAFSPLSLLTLSDRSLIRLRTLSDELNLRLHVPLHETALEIDESVKRRGLRPLARLEKLNAVAPSLTAVHMSHFTDDEARLLRRRKCVVVRCPTYGDLFDLGGRPMRELGAMRVALASHAGIRGCPFNLFGEMRRVAQPFPEFGGPTAGDVLAMATINAAHALGLQDTVGSLEKGKSADMISLSYPDVDVLEPADVLDFIVRGATTSRVRHAWVGGRRILHDGASACVDENSLARAIAERVAKYDAEMYDEGSGREHGRPRNEHKRRRS